MSQNYSTPLNTTPPTHSTLPNTRTHPHTPHTTSTQSDTHSTQSLSQLATSYTLTHKHTHSLTLFAHPPPKAPQHSRDSATAHCRATPPRSHLSRPFLLLRCVASLGGGRVS
ncbi:hypothetical protein E2C01_066015 [Portunus trituberculatus]|uniref:Uncharacterized protein n=1 Tax=Portunus trituberculatus TaxID=210409 RepID=A0A5B7HPV7_PORTR|nr:hypothetical protein [Portunus trituberculatus]